MKISTHLKNLVVVMVLLTGTFSASAQQTQIPKSEKQLTYGFVSPNTKEGLKLDDAIEGLDSTEEWNLIRRATNLRCVVRTEIRVYRALGSWTDGTEPSTMLQVHTDEPTIRYLVARLGRDMDQKSVLYFHVDDSGPAKLYILQPNRIQKFQTIIRLLDRAGIAFRTLVPTRTSTFIYLVDDENKLREQVFSAARLLNARVSVRTGTAQFIGDSSEREKARSIYTQELEGYEQTHRNLPDACRSN